MNPAQSGVLSNVRVPVEVVLGGADLGLRELSEIGVGSIVELNSMAGEPVELRASGTVIARGEVVVIDENFGIRVTQVLDRGSQP